MTDFSGEWHTSFGPMNLVQEGHRVHGVYFYMNIECTLEGKVAGGKFTFTYQEPTVRGEGWFELKRHGNALSGQYRPDGADRWEAWEGERIGFDGLWNSTFGLMRLFADNGKVQGCYEGGGSSTLAGKCQGSRLTFTYQEPKARGE